MSECISFISKYFGKAFYSLVQYWWYLSQAIAAMKLIDANTEIIP